MSCAASAVGASWRGTASGRNSFDLIEVRQALSTGKEGSLGSYPVTYSTDGNTFWFNDPSDAQITIRLDANFEVIEVQRQP
jgi:hypothetical protein